MNRKQKRAVIVGSAVFGGTIALGVFGAIAGRNTTIPTPPVDCTALQAKAAGIVRNLPEYMAGGASQAESAAAMADWLHTKGC
jgi:hypothetical protein